MRLLTVARTRAVTPLLRCVTLTGEDLAGFLSAGPDDHVKVFFPLRPGERPAMPDRPRAALGPGADGAPADRLSGLVARDFTPRRFDARKLELDLEFVLHGHGPASAWAAQAAPGQPLGIGGPRGSFVLHGRFDWYLLVGDAAALPSIARRVEEVPAGTAVTVIAEVANAAEERSFTTAATLDLRWLHLDGATPGDSARLRTAVAAWQPPPGTGFAWVAAESAVARELRQHLVDSRGFDKARVKASGYWRRGASATHDKFDD